MSERLGASLGRGDGWRGCAWGVCLCGQLEELPSCCQRLGGRCVGMAVREMTIQGVALQEMALQERGFQKMAL